MAMAVDAVCIEPRQDVPRRPYHEITLEGGQHGIMLEEELRVPEDSKGEPGLEELLARWR